MKKFIVLLALVVAASARPQDYDDDYDQPQVSHRPANRHNQHSQHNQQNQHVSHTRARDEDRETSTWIPIIEYDKQQQLDGSYNTHYETGNNIVAQESGFLKDKTEDNPAGVLVQKGSYSYETPEGEIINVEYQADENGFRVTGDHLPTPPPVSPEIQRGLDLIYEGIRLQEERRRNNPNYAIDQAERERLNYLGLWIPS